MDSRSIAVWSTALFSLGITLGAFGAHGLKELVSPYQLAVYEKGVLYQLLNSLALLALAALTECGLLQARQTKRIAKLVIFGTCVFSGSLCALGITGVTWLGAITPVGGVAIIAGWIMCTVALFRNRAVSSRSHVDT